MTNDDQQNNFDFDPTKDPMDGDAPTEAQEEDVQSHFPEKNDQDEMPEVPSETLDYQAAPTSGDTNHDEITDDDLMAPVAPDEQAAQLSDDVAGDDIAPEQVPNPEEIASPEDDSMSTMPSDFDESAETEPDTHASESADDMPVGGQDDGFETSGESFEHTSDDNTFDTGADDALTDESFDDDAAFSDPMDDGFHDDAELVADDFEDDYEPKKKGSSKALIGLVILAILGGGCWFFMMGPGQSMLGGSGDAVMPPLPNARQSASAPDPTSQDDALMQELAQAPINGTANNDAMGDLDDILPPMPTAISREDQPVPAFPNEELNPVAESSPAQTDEETVTNDTAESSVEVSDIAPATDAASNEAFADLDALFADIDAPADSGESAPVSSNSVSTDDDVDTSQNIETLSEQDIADIMSGASSAEDTVTEDETPDPATTVQNDAPAQMADDSQAPNMDMTDPAMTNNDIVMPQPQTENSAVVADLQNDLTDKENQIAQLEAQLAQYRSQIEANEQELARSQKELTDALQTIENVQEKAQEQVQQAAAMAAEAKQTARSATSASAPARRGTATTENTRTQTRTPPPTATKETSVDMPQNLQTPNRKPQSYAVASQGNWVIRGATATQAWVSNGANGEIMTVTVGDILPGIGAIRGIRQVNNSWMVIGETGALQSQ